MAFAVWTEPVCSPQLQWRSQERGSKTTRDTSDSPPHFTLSELKFYNLGNHYYYQIFPKATRESQYIVQENETGPLTLTKSCLMSSEEG